MKLAFSMLGLSSLAIFCVGVFNAKPPAVYFLGTALVTVFSWGAIAPISRAELKPWRALCAIVFGVVAQRVLARSLGEDAEAKWLIVQFMALNGIVLGFMLPPTRKEKNPQTASTFVPVQKEPEHPKSL